MTWLGGHLGTRVSALLDGQLPAEEEERAWDHVHTCHLCRDLVEREGWVKTRLAGLSWGSGAEAPGHLRGSLLQSSAELDPGFGPGRSAGLDSGLNSGLTPGEAFLVAAERDHRGRRVGLVALGSGAAGAAVMGVLALGSAPADVPNLDRRAPTTSVNAPGAPVTVGPNRRSLAP